MIDVREMRSQDAAGPAVKYLGRFRPWHKPKKKNDGHVVS